MGKMISCVEGGETSQTLDANYYRGTGARSGKEREVIAVEERDEQSAMGERTGGGGAMNSVVRRLTPLE